MPTDSVTVSGRELVGEAPIDVVSEFMKIGAPARLPWCCAAAAGST